MKINWTGLRQWLRRRIVWIVLVLALIFNLLMGIIFPRPTSNDAALEPKINELQTSVAAVEGRLTTIEGKVVAVTGTAGAAEIDSGGEKIYELQRENDKLEATIREKELEIRIAVLEVKVEERERDIDEIKDGIKDVDKPSSQPPTYPSDALSGKFAVAVYQGENFNSYVGSLADESVIDHYWGSGGPLGLRDNFSVRWEGSFNFGTGNYLFDLVADEGARLFIDNQLKIDNWGREPGSKTGAEAEVYLTAGYHYVRLDYFDRSGQAVARLHWYPK